MAPQNSQSRSLEMRGAHRSDAIAAHRQGESTHNPLASDAGHGRAAEYKKVSEFILVDSIMFAYIYLI